MSDRMTPISFDKLMEHIVTEEKNLHTVFGIHRPYIADKGYDRTIFGRDLETPIGPAAGPHTQLAQNIIAAYYAGSRFFELKTVQKIDGEDLPVSKPCIKADDECYNVEWSTELTVPQAQSEYIKAWFALKVMAIEYGLGSPDGFQFNMSVGYDLDGIKLPKVDSFINNMMDASNDETYIQCKKYLMDNLSMFKKVKKEDVEKIQPQVCNSATISTLHGCPPQEIERIANHLICDKGLNTFIKCNPTLLGYKYARETLDAMGYDYIQFGEFHFNDDLQYTDAVPMLQRLMKLCEEKHLEFGVKITNTFPVDIKAMELPGEEMYMSGKSLYPLSISVAARLSRDFDGKLRIAYSGGADAYNIKDIVDCGVWPVTMATTMLKPGGYQRLQQIAEITQDKNGSFKGIDVQKITKLEKDAVNMKHHIKPIKPLPERKNNREVPLVDCFIAPCQDTCPIHQDITTYMQLVGEGKYEEALDVILEKNPLPFITGTICPHGCMGACTRNFYEEPVHIRDMKLTAAEHAYDACIAKLSVRGDKISGKTAIIGGGPAGMAAAYFLKRSGKDVTIYEASDSLGGTVRHVIPEFRISKEAIDKDASWIEKLGVEVKYNTKIDDVSKLKSEGYDSVIIAIGASKPGVLKLESGESINALEFLADYKKNDGKITLGKNVVVIGGGNTAMDTARAARKVAGVEHVYLVYRRTAKYMPADEEELKMAIDDGVEFKELLAPVKIEGGKLICDKMTLTDPDESGRRGVAATGESEAVPADVVIGATGEQVDTEYLKKQGLALTGKGRAQFDQVTCETSEKGVYVIGDTKAGAAVVVKAIADARAAADTIIKRASCEEKPLEADHKKLYDIKGILTEFTDTKHEESRCLNCNSVCENCVDVCPNRANVAITVPGKTMNQIIHVDYMCNECGNCRSFCPYISAPYIDKFTLFANEKDMMDSTNQGFMVVDQTAMKFKLRLRGHIIDWKHGDGYDEVSADLAAIMETVVKDYNYLII